MPGQRRLAISRLRVPNLDGGIPAAAGNLLSIGAPRHSRYPEIARSQHTNRQKQRGKNLKKNLQTRVPGQSRLANVTFSNLPLNNLFSSIYLSKKRLPFRVTGLPATGAYLFKTYRLECPVSVELQWPVEMSQILTVLSSLPLATSLPSGEKATELTL